MKKRKATLIKVMAVLLAAGALAFYGAHYSAEAVFDEDAAVRYEDFAAEHTVEESSLFIGTYLLHIQGLTDELYEKAEESANDSGQWDRFYKSELAGGAWTDITNAVGLQDIAGAGTIVDESELADLWVTHYMGSDGILRDAKTFKQVSLFENPCPYELYDLTELDPLRMQYDSIYAAELGSDPAGLNTYFARKMNELFKTDVHTGETDTYDIQIDGLPDEHNRPEPEEEEEAEEEAAEEEAAEEETAEEEAPVRIACLQSLYDNLLELEEGDLAEIVQTLMGKIDASRRAAVFYQLAGSDDSLLNRLQEKLSGTGYKKGDYNNEDFVTKTELLEAVGDAASNCQTSYFEYSAKALAPSETVLGDAEYTTSMQVIASAPGGYVAEKDLLLKLRYIYSIRDDVITNAEKEIDLLDESLIPAANGSYVTGLGAGVSDEFKAAVQNGYSLAARDQILATQKDEVEVLRSELQFFIKAKTKRMSAQEALDFTYERLDIAGQYYRQTRFDDFQSYAEESIAEHILWLQELAQSIIDGDEALKAEMTRLQEEKDRLLLAKAEALDKNDLAGAAKYDASIAVVDDKLEAEMNRVASLLGASDLSESDRAKALAALGSGTMAGNIMSMKNQALSDLANGNLDGVQNMADALSGLGATSALSDIMDALSNKGDNSADAKDLENALGNALDESKDSPLNGMNGNLGSANDDGTAGASGMAGDLGALSEEELMALLDDVLSEILGGSFDSLRADGQIVAACAMNKLGQEGITRAGTLAVNLMNQCVKNKNKYAYRKLTSGGTPGTEYIPFKNIGAATSYRYVYSDTRKEVAMTGTSATYCFVVGKNTVTQGTMEKSEKLSTNVLFNTLPYLAEKDAKTYFGCEAEYIDNSEYGACLTKKMMQEMDEIVQAVKGGES